MINPRRTLALVVAGITALLLASCSSGPQPAPDRLAVGTELCGDARDGGASRVQPRCILIPSLSPGVGGVAPARRCSGLGAVRCDRGHGDDGRGCLFPDLLGRQPDRRMLAVHKGLNSITEVAQQMPAVRDLNRTRCTLPRTVRVGAGPVACHHLDPGVLA